LFELSSPPRRTPRICEWPVAATRSARPRAAHHDFGDRVRFVFQRIVDGADGELGLKAVQQGLIA